MLGGPYEIGKENRDAQDGPSLTQNNWHVAQDRAASPIDVSAKKNERERRALIRKFSLSAQVALGARTWTHD